ncbi:SHD1 domain-containing protein [Pontiella desulfatans]|uniref:SHD1 domain-containing protein n=1 Tax=Pontiella desulfatans TaxID=2750659 RepID=UPI00109D7A47|nr:SHD1 domain-containing protein [Pontiella desulfatans]
MIKKGKKTKGVVKGAPSGFVVSLLVHAAAFLLAGMLVVFTVHQKEETKFVPPKPVDRPKMKLKKPKVKVKKTAKPKPTTRIVTKVKRASMPDIQLPEMSGMADGLVGDIGGFELLPDLQQMTVFGGGQTIGNDFVGTFYDFKRDRAGRPIPMSDVQFVDAMIKFNSSGWKPSSISRYYRSPNKRYATSFMMPPIRSSVAPTAFNEADTIGYAWMVHYKGKLVYPEDIKFRFWGMGDDILAVRVNGEIVLNACWEDNNRGTYLIGGKWVSNATKNRQFYMGNNLAWGGDWIELKAGEPVDMEVIVGEVPGGTFCSMLTVEVEDAEYENNRQSRGIFPMFKTAETTHDLADAILEHLVPGEADVFKGPIFRDYLVPENTNTAVVAEQEAEAPEPGAEEEPSKMRLWTLNNGKTVEAEYITKIGNDVVLRSAKGKQVKVPVAEVSAEDIDYIQISNPPKFSVDFLRSSKQVFIETTPYLNETPPRVLEWTFGAKLKQENSMAYDHELKVEYYAFGQQYLDADKYKLLDHQVAHFTPTAENKRAFRMEGKRAVQLMDYDLMDHRRGMRVAESLVLVTDVRGEIVAYNSTANWLYDNLETLQERQVGQFLDKSCERVYPTGPKPTRY